VEATGYVEATPLDLAMSDAALRLVECLRSPVDAEILGPGIVREIVYRALCGPQGHLLLEMVGRHGHPWRQCRSNVASRSQTTS